MKKIVIIFSLLLAFNFLFSNELEVDAYVDQTKIGTSDQLTLTLEISGEKANNVRTPQLPDIKGFRVNGPSTSSSSSYSLINGKMTSEVKQKYIYTLIPKKTGNFLIPPISVKFGKQTYTTDPINIKVVQGSTEPAPPTSSRLRNNRNSTTTSSNLEDNLFVRTKISNKSPYKDEPILVEYTLYTRYDISNLSFGNDPAFTGFWKEDVFTPTQISFSRKNLDGIVYNTMLMRSIALFPTQTGTLEIPALELLVDIRTQSNSFFDFGSTKRYSIKSKSEKIKVKELPETGKPSGFINAVGNFNVSSQISESQLKVGDSFTYTLKLSGKGNLKQFDIPKLPEIKHLRFLEPEITTNINKDMISGSKTIKYLVIAQEKGTFDIPAIEFSYFDVQQQKYVTKRSKQFKISVAEGEGSFIASSTAQSSVTQEGRDIGFIIRSDDLQHFKIYFDSMLYWIIFFGILITIPFAVFYTKEQEKLIGNIDYQRQKQAAKILKRYMKQATEMAEKADVGFYASAQTGLSSYLADKLRINRGSTTDQINAEIAAKDISDEMKIRIKEMFEKCNQARFMPGGFSKENIRDDFKLMKEIVSDLVRMKF
ncbi:MAG: hypothetical protein DRH79_07710 [Candidatus Cloacimonadota bacterium]|nr:MAG: hypothetical protein DRH79_07710 [Candidatus Cloacimonadota bacterium]